MRINDARCLRRFFAYLIDMFLIGTVTSLILLGVPIYQELADRYQTLYQEYTDAVLNGVIGTDYYTELLQIKIKMDGLTCAVMFPLMVLYLVILPHFWKAQTVGRLAMGLRVMTIDEKEVGWKALCLRELVGGFLCYQVLGSIIVLPILTWVYSATRGRSLADMIGGTRLINIHIEKPEEPKSEEQRDFVDAKFKEVQQEETSEEPASAEQPSSQQDEYQVL